jgi:hypothetical protein
MARLDNLRGGGVEDIGLITEQDLMGGKKKITNPMTGN